MATEMDPDDPYRPEKYRCTGYDSEDYEWFSGLSHAKDQRFLVELESGTMDKLPDVRPFLYCVGYWHGNRSSLSKDLDSYPDGFVEDFFVKAGREHLLAEKRSASSGYFLADRDWAAENIPDGETMPYIACVGCEPMEGDIGFGSRWIHREEDDDVLIGGLVKTNLRSPLPLEHVTRFKPGDDGWDGFIRWLYGFQGHPVFGLVYSSWSVGYVHHERSIQDLLMGRKYMTEEADDYYPNC